ncbi:MAG: hypothetical protein KC776_37280 [Myxococcales bacterium]|nr:hypothetical protein [Myxococcales bacterium]
MSGRGLRCQEPHRLSKQEVEAILENGTPLAISEALVSAAFHQSDREFARRVIFEHARNGSDGTRATAVLCIGHVARIDGDLPPDLVVELVADALCDEDPAVRGQAIAALQDIECVMPDTAARIKALASCK